MSQKYEATGQIKVIGDTQSFASGFSKREFVITTDDGKYPQDLKFEVAKDGCAKLDAFDIGEFVTVAFNLRGNEYNGKYYVNLSAWKVESNQAAAPRDRSPAGDRKRAEQAKPTVNDSGWIDDGDPPF